MVAVPADTAVTTPLEAFTVATAVLDDVQLPPASPFVLKLVVPGMQIDCIPLMVPALGQTGGGGLITLTVMVCVFE